MSQKECHTRQALVPRCLVGVYIYLSDLDHLQHAFMLAVRYF